MAIITIDTEKDIQALNEGRQNLISEIQKLDATRNVLVEQLQNLEGSIKFLNGKVAPEQQTTEGGEEIATEESAEESTSNE
tara:strand:- start:1308 stop:1550 length:243 start_codon:yes stop_codon:yes gene_type:complete